MKRVIIDTDAGVDDSLAIALAMLSPELQVEAITTVSGNVEVHKCERNVRLVLETLQIEVPPPVAKGEAAPLVRPLLTAPEVHGSDGVGGITEILLSDGSRKYPEPEMPVDRRTGSQLILELARKYGPELTIITLGPLTNIAQAIMADPVAMKTIGSIAMMGGAFRVYGNTSAVAEFNIYVDPDAAKIVFNLGVPITVFPLDVTEQLRLMRQDVESTFLANPSRIMEFMRDISSFYMDYHRKHDGFDGCYMHDPLTVGAVIDPSFVRTIETWVDIETVSDLTRGMTVAELRTDRLPVKTNAQVAVEVDAERFIRFFLDRIAKE
ncbi:MAG TPA: nucleoside hydrolase [Armatimonadota bacterium]|jgi:purine nucleosidase|nr:nucleoside hydrolase [Armatimonadota bacterium]HOM70784.1 nucleoside hydrolase [Armatimonadota bacterium]HPP75109.1 nucleoside hydrolase [Armatimonadota bacterium]